MLRIDVNYFLPFSEVVCGLPPSLFLSPESPDELLRPVQFLTADVDVGLQGGLLELHGIKLVIQQLELVCGEKTLMDTAAASRQYTKQ